jgi:hypothetical protein
MLDIENNPDQEIVLNPLFNYNTKDSNHYNHKFYNPETLFMVSLCNFNSDDDCKRK